MWSIECHTNTVFNSNSYRIGNCMIDPGDEWSGFEEVAIVLLTHVHFDHIYGLNNLLRLNPQLLVYTNQWGLEALNSPKMNMSKYHDAPFIFENTQNVRVVEDGEFIDLGDGLFAKAIFTPGHNPSCITWMIKDALFTGDSYIPGVKTVTNLTGSNKELALVSEQRIKSLLEGRIIYPGHKVGNAKIQKFLLP